MLRIFATAALAAFALGAPPAFADTPAPNDYAKTANWLCWPGQEDACAGDNTATIVAANGTLTEETWTADPKAPIDCFYVYPTVSRDPGMLSDMTPGSEEIRVAEQQLSRLGSKCRIFAPMYRQFTLTALVARMRGGPNQGAAGERPTTPYDDVKAAWDYYLAHENMGRGVVLIGHSQGSGVLTQLIAREIDGKPVQKQIVSAILMGTSLPVKVDETTGTFQHLPLCSKAGQFGCVVAFASFRDDSPPPQNSRFGRPWGDAPGMEAACVNPAALAGGPATLHPYLASGSDFLGTGGPAPDWVKGGPKVTTPFVALPGFLTAECVRKDGFHYLSVHANVDPADPRTDTYPGDVLINGQVAKDWGLHLVDVQIVMGDLVRLVGEQGAAWKAANR